MPSARATIARTAASGRPGDEAGEELAHRGRRERLEVERGEVALAGAPVGPLLEELRPAERHDVDRRVPAPLDEVVDEVDQAGVGEVEVLEDQDDRGGRREPLEERPPGAEQLLRADARLDAEQGQERRLDPAPLVGVRDVLGERSRRPWPGSSAASSVSSRPARRADHLAERPEADPVAVGRAAALVAPDRLDEAVEVLEELPGEPGLADPARPDHADEAGPALARRGVEQVLEQAQLVVATDERGLERLAPVPPADLGDDPQRAPGRDRGRLALERLLAGLLEGDRPRRRPLGRLADEDRARLGRRLEPAAVLTRSPATMPLVRRADRDRRLAGQDPGPGLDRPGRATGPRRRARGRPGRPARRRPRGRRARPRRP